MSRPAPNPLALSLDFSIRLFEQLGVERMREVLRRNALPEYADSCASHDFCDANIVMLEAYAALAGVPADEITDCDCDTMMAIMSEAWDIARNHSFGLDPA